MQDEQLASSPIVFDETEDSVLISEVSESKPDIPDYASLTDETITNEHIDEMKLLGLPKPEAVGWPRWMGPRDVKQRHEHIIHLAALGMTNRQIAKELSANEGRLSIILNTPIIKKAIAEKRREYYGDNAREYFKALIHPSFEVLDTILKDPNEKSTVRLDAAKYIVDQTVGKAQQSVEVKGNLLVDLLAKLDEEARNATPLATSANDNFLAHPKDSMDNFVEEMIPESIVVGKKSLDEK